MRASREGDRIRLALSSGERAVLRHVLESLASAYRTPPDRIDPRVAGVWYSDRGCRAAGMTEEEALEWTRQLHGFKGENLALIERCLEQLRGTGAKGAGLIIPLDGAEAFVGALNDHRLRMAAEHAIGQEEMDLRDFGAAQSLGMGRHGALMQIHFLAWIIEVVLRLIAPEAADWGSVGQGADGP